MKNDEVRLKRFSFVCFFLLHKTDGVCKEAIYSNRADSLWFNVFFPDMILNPTTAVLSGFKKVLGAFYRILRIYICGRKRQETISLL